MKEDLKGFALRRCYEIEETHGHVHVHVPPHIMSVYILMRAIALGDLDSYIQEIGPMAISKLEAEQGKQELGWGRLTPFELECMSVVNRFVERHQSPHLIRSGQFR